MPILKRDDAEIYYEEVGSGFPILLLAPGGMRSAIAMWHAPEKGPPRAWNDWTEVLAPSYRVIAMDQRNAGRSRGAIVEGHGWQTYAEDQLALMDRLGIDRFHTLGGCIGSSFCLKLCEMAPSRIQSAVLQNPIGVNAEFPTYFPDGFVEWAAEIRAGRADLDAKAVEQFGKTLWGGDFVFCVGRDVVRRCHVPCLVMPGNDKPHPESAGLELAATLPRAEMLRDWKGPAHLDAARAAVLAFLAKHTPAGARRAP